MNTQESKEQEFERSISAIGDVAGSIAPAGWRGRNHPSAKEPDLTVVDAVAVPP
jgi:hypothetical protein